MGGALLEYRLRIRDAADATDALTVTSVRGDALPYLQAPPHGDGSSFDPLTGDILCGAYTGTIVDGEIGGMQRVLTAQMEDTEARAQLGYRRAVVESRQDGGAWRVLLAGFLTLLRLTDAITWEYTVSDPTRAQMGYQLFKPLPDETIAEFLARWPTRGCILGGPVMGGLGPVPDLGGWEFRVLRAGNAFGYGTTYQLTFVAGYGPPDFVRSREVTAFIAQVNDAVADRLQPVRSLAAGTAITTVAQAASDASVLSGVIVLLDDTTVALPTATGDLANDTTCGSGRNGVLPLGTGGLFVHGPTLTVGAVVRVRMLTVEASDSSPIYWAGHPIDFLTTVWDEMGLPWDAAAVTSAKQRLGTDLRIAIRVTAPQDAATYLQALIFQPFGVAVRTSETGALMPIITRIISNTLPTVLISDADVTEDGTTLPFELDAAGGCLTRLIVRETLLVPVHRRVATRDPGDPLPLYPVLGGYSGAFHVVVRGAAQGAASVPTDGLLVQSSEVQIANADPGALGHRSVTIDIPGMVYRAGGWIPDLMHFAAPLAAQLFDRFGRGTIAGSTVLLRGGTGDAVALGDEILLNMSQQPNHNYRLGDNAAIAARAMQVVQLTELPTGRAVHLIDSGPNAEPFGTRPTLNVAQSPDQPNTTAQVTITNAATLNGLGAACRIQLAVTDGSAPATGQYVDANYQNAGVILSGAIRLPSVTPGQTVYVIARSEHSGSRPSNWSAAVSVTLGGLNAPSALTATSSTTDASLCTLAWAIGSNAGACLTEVFLRASATPFADAVRRAVLPAGSVQYVLDGLVSGTSYIASVRHRDPATGDTSAVTDVSFSAGATTRTLAAPVYPHGFAGDQDAVGLAAMTGHYGLAVIAAELPGMLEVAEAVETTIGSGTFGAFLTVGTVAAVQGGWTVWAALAPSDGLRRRLKARQIGDGVTASAYTDMVDVTPWTPEALVPYPTQVFVELTVLDPDPPSDAAHLVRFAVTGVDPAGRPVQTRVSALTSNLTIAVGPAVGALAPNGQVWKVWIPAMSAGPGMVSVEVLVAGVATGAQLAVGTATNGAPTVSLQLYSDPGTSPVTVHIDGALGAGASGHLDWSYRVSTETGTGAWSAWATATDLPQDVTVALLSKHNILIQARVQQPDGQVTESAVLSVLGTMPAIETGSGRVKRSEPLTDGGYAVASSSSDGYTAHTAVKESGGRAVNRLYAKSLPGDPDSLDGVRNGTTYGRPKKAALDDSGNVDFGASAVINKTADKITYTVGGATVDSLKPAAAGADVTGANTAYDTARVSGTAAATVQSGAARGQGGFTDSTGSLVSTAKESGGKAVNKLYAKSLPGDPDSLDGVRNGTTYGRPKKAALDDSGNVDFSGAGFVNKDVDHISEGNTYKRLPAILSTQIQARTPQATNLLFNPSFDDGLAFWTSVAGTLSAGWDAAKAASGYGYAQFVGAAATHSYYTQSDATGAIKFFRVRPGERYYFGAKAYRESGDATVRTRLYSYDKDQSSLGAHLGAGVTSAAWTLSAGLLAVPDDGTNYIALYGWIDNDGTVATTARFDDFFLTPADAFTQHLDEAGNGTGDLQLDGATVVREGSFSSRVYRHREECTVLGPDTDGDIAVTFVDSYQNTPSVVLKGMAVLAYDNMLTGAQTLIVKPVGVTASGFTARAQIATLGATTARNLDFASGNSITAAGGTAESAAVVSGPGTADHYEVHYYVQVVPPTLGHAGLVLAIEAQVYTGSWTEIATFSYGADDGVTNTWSLESQGIDFAGMVGGSQFRLRAKTFSGGGSFTVRGGDGSGSNPETYHGVTYTTSTDTVHSALPSAAQSVQFVATEVI